MIDIPGRNLLFLLLYKLAQSRTIVEPKARSILIRIQIGELSLQLGQRIVEYRNDTHLIRLDHAQPDMAFFQAANLLFTYTWRTAQEYGPRHPAGRHISAKTRITLINLERFRILAINLRIHDRIPILRQ